MDKLRNLIAERGIDTKDVIVNGTMALRFTETKPHHGGTKVDEYKGYFTKLSLTLPDGSTIELDEPVREEFGDTVKVVVILPLYTRIQEAGSKAPLQTEKFSIPYNKVDALVRIHRELLVASIDNDNARITDLAWERFTYSRSYEESPCDREIFEGLHKDFRDSPYLASMGFGDYYDWFVGSSQKLSDDDTLTPEAAAEANRLLDVWTKNGDMDRESLVYWTNRNLEVHPRHQPLYDALVGAKLAPATPILRP